MNIFCVDDNVLHRKKLIELVTNAFASKNIKRFNIVECANGGELMANIATQPPAIVLLDIHMPVMDGLSTLVKIRQYDKKCVVIMVSSENAIAVTRFKHRERSQIDDDKKRQLLQKVIDRVRLNTQEEGKINSVLEACGNLELDPIETALDLGADGFISKPYDVAQASAEVAKFITASFSLAK